jgi:hypothetical protein
MTSQDRSSFWARQTRKDKVTITAFAVQLAISVGLLLVGVLNNDSTFSLGGRFALLTGNIVVLVATLQFAISRFFDDQKDQIGRVGSEMEDVKRRISQTLEEMESITVLGETYIKIFQQEEVIKNQYQSTLDTFLRRLSNCIDDKRSGALDKMEYYGVLENLASSLEKDKFTCEATGVSYDGGIWALTFFLDDEWDDGNIHEIKWFETLKRMDQHGIPTRRLWAFDKKLLALLKKDPIEEDGCELLRRLSLYCADRTDFANTLSYALPKWEILDEHVRLFGKGFIAAAFSSGGFSLIRGVCFDNLLSSNSLGGEIDFDEARIRQIRLQWERYLALARPLKEYLRDAGSTSARDFMQTTWTSSTSSGPSETHEPGTGR